MFKPLIIAGLIVSVLLLACGPTANPVSGEGSSKSAGVEPTSTPTPQPTKPASTPTPLPTKPTSTPTPLPTKPASTPKPAQPTKPPLATPTPEPPYEPPTAHPGGLDGCKAFGLFGPPDEIAYFEWCSEQVTAEVKSGCPDLDTEDAQLACGEEIVAEYKSFSVREGPFKCKGLSSGSERLEQCLLTSVDDVNKAYIALHEAWGKVRARACRQNRNKMVDYFGECECVELKYGGSASASRPFGQGLGTIETLLAWWSRQKGASSPG